MKELIVQGPGQLAWVEAPDPQLATPASALVRPIASASCDLDRRLIAGTTPFKPPFALGHECVQDARVLVVGGTESLGVLAVQMARAAGAASVDYLDEHPLRQQLAACSGAGVDLAGRDLDRSYDLVISATRDHQALRRGLLALAPGGHCSCIGIIFDDPKIPLFDMYLRDVTFSIGACSVQQHIPKVLDLVHRGRCDPLLVNPQVVGCEDAPQALIQPLTKCIVVRERIT